MKHVYAALLGVFCLVWFGLFPNPGWARSPDLNASSEAVETAHLKVELLSQTQGLVPGATHYLGLRVKIAKDWHIYWKNPGDSGLPVTLDWTLPPGIRVLDILWPTPHRLPVGPLMNYGYGDEVVLILPVEASKDLTLGQTLSLRAKASFLVCKDICIPEDLHLKTAIQVQGVSKLSSDAKALDQVLKALPRQGELSVRKQDDSGRLVLTFHGADLLSHDLNGAYVYADQGGIVEHIKPQTLSKGPGGLKAVLAAKATEAPFSGVLALKDGTSFAFQSEAGALFSNTDQTSLAEAPKASSQGGQFWSRLLLGDPSTASMGLNLPIALGFAVLGGLILNLMPCVFPVLSMKAASLAKTRDHPEQARKDGLAFLLGVELAFGLLGLVLLLARAGGEAIGWGFQLQYPWVTALLVGLILTVGLNLSGVFEIGTSLQGVGQDLPTRSKGQGAFFTGILAVVVAAPCTAPFMASALGYAVTRPALEALLIFLGLGLGLALPFLAISFIPALLRHLPRPGPWMATAKHVLALPMYGTALWLAWVCTQQSGPVTPWLLLAAAVVLGLGLWQWGQSQRAQGQDQGEGGLGRSRLLALGLCLAGIVGFGLAGTQGRDASQNLDQDLGVNPKPVSARALNMVRQTWSPEQLASLQAEGRPVIVDFTADWCVTCKVNERTSLTTPKVIEALKAKRGVLLVADWTLRDDRITEALRQQGRSGVPLYLVYPTNGGPPEVLPQLLTEALVLKALDRATK